MTGQQEYRITDEQITKLLYFEDMFPAISDIINKIRSRPVHEQQASPKDSGFNEQPVKECIGRYDECASEDGCPFIVHCILASNNLRPYKKNEQQFPKPTDEQCRICEQSIRDKLYQEIWADAYADGHNRGCEDREQAIRKDATGKVLDKAIEHWKQVIENGKGVTYNHPVSYRWMYSGVVKYLEELRKGDQG